MEQVILDGISGTSYSGDIISSCYNTSAVTGTLNVGGIVGYSETATVKNCYNRGAITATGKNSYGNTNAGGIVGANTTRASVIGCYNTGNISGVGQCIGGIVGWNGNPSTGHGGTVVKNTFNAGVVKRNGVAATTYVGTSSTFRGYIIGYYNSPSGYYSNTTQAAVSVWTYEQITTNLSTEFTNDIQEEGVWKYNDGYPILKWQAEELETEDK